MSDVLPERRAVTVMFCDLVGSTAMSEILDPEELLDVVTSYQTLCRERIEEEGGHVAKYLGDGVLAFFGYPVANDDDPRRSVRAGLAIAASIGDLNQRLDVDVDVRTRIGIHTGPVVAGMLEPGSNELSVVGTTPNVAARLQDFAEPDSVLVSADTQRLCAGFFRWEEVGALELKGIADPVQAFRPTGETNVRNPFELAVRQGLRPLVGRAWELEALRNAFHDAEAGHGRTVRVSGEGGIGKSRLLHALRTDETVQTAAWATGRCSPQTKNAAFFPVIEAARALLGIDQSTVDVDPMEQLERTIDDAQVRAHLRSILDVGTDGSDAPAMSPELARRRQMEALVDLFVRTSHDQPVILTLEDLHWVDPSTLEFLAMFRPAMATERILLLLSTRPTESELDDDELTEIELQPLRNEAVRDLVSEVSGGADLPGDVVDQIAQRADGVPLFVEELTKMVLESAAVEGGADIGGTGDLSIPSSLEGSLQTRLDRLGDAKSVMQLAAVVGHDFDRTMLTTLGLLDEDLIERSLDALVTAELLTSSGSGPDPDFSFRHALIQNAAYQSLLKKTRRGFHARIAECASEGEWGSRAARPEELAHHFSQAGLPERAIPHWRDAGELAAERSANAEAIAYYRRGLVDLQSLDPGEERDRLELALVMGLGPAFTAARGYGSSEAVDAYARALELCEALGDPPELFWVLWGLGAFSQARGQHAEALEKGRQIEVLAEARPELLAEAHFGIGTSLFYLGEVGPARDALEEGAEFFLGRAGTNELSPTGHHAGVMTLGYLAIALWQLGFTEQADRRTEQSIRVAESMGHPFVSMHSMHWASTVTASARDLDKTRAYAESELQIASDFGFPFGEIGSGMTLAWLDALDGDADAVDRFRGLLGAYRGIGARVGVTYFLWLLADACLVADRIDDASAAIADAFDEMAETGERAWESELYRMRALARWSDDPSGAEQDLRTALDIAHERGTLMPELRAATSLADLLHDTPQRAEVAARLASIQQSLPEQPRSTHADAV